MEDEKKRRGDITTVYIADIKDQLEELYKKGYNLKDIIKKGIEYIKFQETFPYTISEISNILNEFKKENKILESIVYKMEKNSKKQKKVLLLLLKLKKKKKKKSLLRRLLSRILG